MASNNIHIKSLLFACLTLLLIKLSATTKLGFSVSTHLIQRDSPFSPTFNTSSSSTARRDHHGRLYRSLLRSINRAALYKAAMASHVASLSSSSANQSTNPIQSRIIPSDGEYLMNVSIGNPPVPLLGIADTGSDLIWTQCKPCKRCFKQNPRLYDPSRSSTYGDVACESESCSELPESTCAMSSGGDTCGYSYSYGDRSFTRGTLGSETMRIGSVSLAGMVFGCGHDNGGTFDESGSGLIGLGGGPLSLISQLGNSRHRHGNALKFSYCLVPLSAESYVTSKIMFGDAAAVTGPGVVTTPLVAKEPDTFYYLTLHAISIGRKRLLYTPNDNSHLLLAAPNRGNIIIDSGTTLTFLPAGLHDEVVSALSEAVVGAERVSDPNGVMSLCFRDENDGRFSPPELTVHFEGGDIVLQPMNTFAKVEDDVYCLTMVPSDDVAIFGNLAQMNFLVGYDVEAGTVSFKPTDCSRMTL